MQEVIQLYHDKIPPIVRMFDSLGSFASTIKEMPRHQFDSSLWAGGCTADEQIAKIQHGSTQYVTKAQSMLDSIDTNLGLDTLSTAWGLSVVGSSPNVPGYLAGVPNCMRRIIGSEDQGPIRVLVNMSCSAWATTDDLIARGVYSLALTMALGRVRPVELWVYYTSRPKNTDKYAVMGVKVGSHPIDLSEACVALCEPFMSRSLLFGLGFTLCDLNRNVTDLLQSDVGYCKAIVDAGLYVEGDVIVPRLNQADLPDYSLAAVQAKVREVLKNSQSGVY